ncbi:hypothetical protein IL306_003856 [Fusarium sp. DS 682]|nr:hypothetical protein IL306_003856 [Fusarium sp. DS 682]
MEEGPNQKPEPSPDLDTEVSGPPYALVDQSTPLTKFEEDYNNLLSTIPDFSGFSDDHIDSEEQSSDQDQPVTTTQSFAAPVDWTVGDILEVQQENHNAFLNDYRLISSEERSSLSQVVQTEVQNGMDRIFNYVKSFAPRPAQTSTSTTTELSAQLKAEKNKVKALVIDHNKLVQLSDKQGQNLRKVNAKLDDALRERDHLRQLLEGSSLANSDKATDDEIQGKWKELNYNIRCLAHLLDHDPSHQQPDDLVSRRLRFISTDYRKLSRDAEYRALLMIGYLWVVVQDEIFDAQEPLWGGPELKSYKNLRDHVICEYLLEAHYLLALLTLEARIRDSGNPRNNETSVAHAAKWLAQGSIMMSRLWENDNIRIRHLVHNETRRLRTFHPAQQSRTDRAEKRIFDQLKDIVDSAIVLNKMMMCSKAIFQVHWRDQSQKPGGHQRWNEDAMVAEAYTNDLSPKSRVMFSISPILHKVGTADGQRYNSRMVLAKGVVVCN